MPKPSLSIPQQVAKLNTLGLIDPQGKLPRALIDHGYFRLSGYWRYFQLDPRAGRNTFEHGTDFGDVLDIYKTDATLRNILLEGLSEIETALRPIVVARVCIPGQPGIEYLDTATYEPTVTSEQVELRQLLIADIRSDVNRSKERHVRHYRDFTPDEVPMWVATEAMSFGIVSRLYGLISDTATRTAIASRFGYDGALSDRFASNIRAVSVFRNVCAHHGRLWNRHIRQDVPFTPRDLVAEGMQRHHYEKTTWGAIAVVAHMVEQVRRDSSFMDDIMTSIPNSGIYWDGLVSPSPK